MLQHELTVQSSGIFSAHQGQARYSLGASTVPHLGKHRAQFQYFCSPCQRLWFGYLTICETNDKAEKRLTLYSLQKQYWTVSKKTYNFIPSRHPDDTSMILQWYFYVKQSEKYHWSNSLTACTIIPKVKHKMIQWHFIR